MGEKFQSNRRKALRRDRGRCVDCRAKVFRMHVHHVTPRSEGGSDELDNLTTLCPECHADRHNGYPCSICGGVLHDRSFERAVNDKKGAAVTMVCEDCFDQIRGSDNNTGCSLCHDLDISETRYNASLAAELGPSNNRGICDRCRKMLLFRTQFKTIEYFTVMSPIDFRHWEIEEVDNDE